MSTLAKIRSDLVSVNNRLDVLRNDRIRLQKLELATMAEMDGLVKGKTRVHETGGRGRKGVFIGYHRWVSSHTFNANWIEVLLLKKDGTVGKREATIWDWEKTPKK